MGVDTSRHVKSVDQGITILQAVKRLDGAGITELHEELGLAVGTIHAYLVTLRSNDFVVKRNGKYHVGLGCLEYGGFARESIEFYEYASESLRELAEETGELAAASTQEHGENVYLGYELGARAVNLDIELGSRLPLHCLGSGKAILAALPDRRVEEIVSEKGLSPVTTNTITDETELMEELETIRERGVSFDDEERIEGMRAVAAVVENPETGDVCGAITVSGPKNRMRGSHFRSELPELIRNTDTEIEINLTYS